MRSATYQFHIFIGNSLHYLITCYKKSQEKIDSKNISLQIENTVLSYF